MTIIRRFVEWLSYHPTTEEIARALATEYLAEFSVLGLRFGRINNDDSITNLGQFGFPDSENIRFLLVDQLTPATTNLPVNPQILKLKL